MSFKTVVAKRVGVEPDSDGWRRLCSYCPIGASTYSMLREACGIQGGFCTIVNSAADLCFPVKKNKYLAFLCFVCHTIVEPF